MQRKKREKEREGKKRREREKKRREREKEGKEIFVDILGFSVELNKHAIFSLLIQDR